MAMKKIKRPDIVDEFMRLIVKHYKETEGLRKKDFDFIGRFLTCHLLIEYALTEYIKLSRTPIRLAVDFFIGRNNIFRFLFLNSNQCALLFCLLF